MKEISDLQKHSEHEREILLHQSSKKAFDALDLKKLPPMQTLRQEYATLLAEKKKLAIQQISNREFDMFRTASDSGNREVLDYIYHHFDEFQLMFNRSAGTKYETIRHDLVMLEANGAKRLIVALKKQGLPIREFNDEQLHILYSTALTPLFGIITHAYPYEKALTFMDLMADAMNFGWEKVMNL